MKNACSITFMFTKLSPDRRFGRGDWIGGCLGILFEGQ